MPLYYLFYKHWVIYDKFIEEIQCFQEYYSESSY